jgi:hypothetical protein
MAQTFIVVATFKADTDMAEVAGLVPDEIAKVEELRSAQRMGAVHIALARGTVFIEVIAADEPGAVATVHELPLGKFFDLDVFATMPPGVPEAA